MTRFKWQSRKGFNSYKIEKDVAIIDLFDIKGNKVAETIIDKEDLNKINYSKLSLRNNSYVRNSKQEHLHRIIMDLPKSSNKVINHINSNPLDNRKSNLEIVSQKQNVRASNTPFSHGKSGVRGVSFCKQTNKWRAHITSEGVFYNLGRFENIADAISARKHKEAELW